MKAIKVEPQDVKVGDDIIVVPALGSMAAASSEIVTVQAIDGEQMQARNIWRPLTDVRSLITR